MNLKPKVLLIIILITLIGILLLLQMFSNKQQPTVESSIPKHNTSEVPVNQSISLTFEYPPADPNTISIETIPQIDLQKQWQNNKLVLIPQQPMPIDTKITVTTKYKGKEIHTFTFSTFPLTPQEVKKQGDDQIYSDVQFSEGMRKTYQEKPWLKNLPIIRTEFEAVYDYEQEKIRIEIYDSNTTVEDVIQVLAQNNINAQSIGYYVISQ